jgi:octaprenyl-diphosphate synthase
MTSMSAVQKPVWRELERVQGRLREAFRTPIPILNEVGGHVLATQGKKFRPTLLLLVARLRGHAGEDAVVCATVIEMVHAAAIIHDDSVDKSALRRGRPTVNGLWTDEMAIIVGDYLYAQAMKLLVEHKQDAAMGSWRGWWARCRAARRSSSSTRTIST